jgi:hypothetical protein
VAPVLVTEKSTQKGLIEERKLRAMVQSNLEHDKSMQDSVINGHQLSAMIQINECNCVCEPDFG